MKGKHLESRHETVLISVPDHTDLHLCSANVRSCVVGFLSGSDFTRIVNWINSWLCRTTPCFGLQTGVVDISTASQLCLAHWVLVSISRSSDNSGLINLNWCWNITIFLVPMPPKRSYEDSQSSQTSPKISRLSAGSSDSLPEHSSTNDEDQCPRKLSRRERANFNERRRMHGINAGYDRLKSKIPSIANEKVAKVISYQIICFQFIFRLRFCKKRLNILN